MTKRMWLAAPALTAAALLMLAGCASGTTPTDDAPTPEITLSQEADATGGEPTFDDLLPKNSTGAAVVLRSEGHLVAGTAIDATATDAADGGWIAQFACSSSGAVTAEVLVNDEVVVPAVDVACEAGMPESLKFSGSGTITLRITGEADGLYVAQLTKDAAV